MNEYAIIASMSGDAWFLFCPDGSEKKFNVSPRGEIVEWLGVLTYLDKEFIKKHFDL